MCGLLLKNLIYSLNNTIFIMEAKTTAIIGIIFLVLVIGGALVLSSFGIETVGEWKWKATAFQKMPVAVASRDISRIPVSSRPDVIFTGKRPLIFVHGFGRPCPDSIPAWDEYQDEMEFDHFYADKGRMYVNTPRAAAGSWPAYSSVTMTYYKANAQGPCVHSNLGIDFYAQRLATVVDNVLHNTGESKVDIVAHSMGGLVSRQYIRFHGGDAKVRRLITVATPNHGIVHPVTTTICPVLQFKECADMERRGNFLSNLNAIDETWGGVEYYTVYGEVGNTGTDGIVQTWSVPLTGAADNHKIAGYSHNNFIFDPSFPDLRSYNKIVSIVTG